MDVVYLRTERDGRPAMPADTHMTWRESKDRISNRYLYLTKVPESTSNNRC
jgi:hypothetical protein